MKKHPQIVMPYCIEVCEHLITQIHILADSKHEAIEIVMQQYYNSEIILGSENFTSVDFYARREDTLKNVKRSHGKIKK